ncbi:MAG: DUF2860 family protein [Rhodocyclaceae bacterium]|nr:DUF2860 family protein [Rhodocyclaceae bacterium]
MTPYCSFAIAALLATSFAHAQINPLPRTSGVSGSISLGAAFSNISSNFQQHDDHARIDQFGAPQSHNTTSIVPRFDLRYTLADSRTQFVLGNQIHDALRFDFTQLLAVRQEIGSLGIVSAGLVFTGIAPNEVWTDPYQTATDRSSSDRDSRGVRLGWERMLGSGFSADLTARKIDIEHEESGRSSALSASQSALLDRNGNSIRLRVSYDWEFAPRHFFAPGLIVGREDLDGAAMQYDVTGLKLDYGFNAGSDTFGASLYLAQQRYSEGHPLFANRKADSKDYGLGVNYLRQGLFGMPWLGAYISASYGKSNADIDFFDAEFIRLGTGLRFKF